MSPHLSRAGEWLLYSGIQESNGGVARYYRADTGRNLPVSTEITGYAVSALVYLHSLTGDDRYLDQAVAAARFLLTAWDVDSQTMPFEVNPATLAYFFDDGIIVRGLLAVWRATGAEEFLDVAASVGRCMLRDFAAPGGDFHPILILPDKQPLERDILKWSRSAGCYQLKSAMAWWDLAEATGDEHFREPYRRVLTDSLKTWTTFLPGHPEQFKVMDRLHAFLYFLEGLLPAVEDPRCASALCGGIHLVAQHLRRIAPEFARSDVYAQLLRIRLYAGWAGVAALDQEAAQEEADCLREFQASDTDLRINGGFRFGKTGDTWLPHVNPVSTSFALQALALWEANGKGAAPVHRHLLI